MSNSDNHHENQNGNSNLAFTSGDLGVPSGSGIQRADSNSSWPLHGRPPSYTTNDGFEMRNLGPPQPPDQPLPEEQAAPDTRDKSFNFGFFKPQKDPRIKYLLGVIAFLILVIIILVTVFLALTQKKQAQLLSQNTTIYITATTATSTTLFSTNILTTILTSLATTTSLSVRQTTQTTTQTSSPPNPTSVNDCWDLLSDICANTTQVPSNLDSGLFGDCKNIFGFFYCGVIQDLEAEGIFIISPDDSPLCFGMRDFCNGIHIGDPLGLHSSPAASTSSVDQIVPVTKRGVARMRITKVAEKQFPRINLPAWTPGPRPTMR